MWWKRLANVIILTAGQVAFAQRSSTESICDYYARQRYGANNVTTQFRLVQSIVTLAYAGGSGVPDSLKDNTGIFNHGDFNGIDVYLRPWFDGSKATTNLNNQPVGVNWLDGGATEPLMAFLNGSTDSVVLNNSTNQFRLFTHWFTAFGYVYGCSLVSKFPRTADSGPPLSISYVHKYMNLNQTHLGYFIEQLTIASKYFGFSEQDAETLDTSMNARYNVRCAPAVNGQLFSLCLAAECPLAQPKPDCDAYNNLGPNGAANSTGGATGAPTSTPTSTATAPPTSSNPSSATGSATPKPTLSGGAIAGIAIGGAAVFLFAVGLWLFFRRQSTRAELVPVPVHPGGYASPSHASHTYYSPNPHTSFPPGPHESYMGGQGGMPGYWVPKPEDMHHVVQEPASTQAMPEMQVIAEMPSPSYPPPLASQEMPPRVPSSSNTPNPE